MTRIREGRRRNREGVGKKEVEKGKKERKKKSYPLSNLITLLQIEDPP